MPVYADFIPENERKGGLGEGFRDFVPESDGLVLKETSVTKKENDTKQENVENPNKDELNEIDEALKNPEIKQNNLDGIKGIGKASVEKLKKINITTPEQLVQMSDEQLSAVVGKLNVKKMKTACMQIIASA